MSEEQTMEFGRTRQQKWAGLGGHTGHSVAPLTRCRAVLASPPKVGKSCLLQSNPDAYIFNFDQSSTVTSTPRAVLYPIVGDDGSCLLDNGPGVLSFDLIRQKHAALLQLARDNRPRPSLVVNDSLTTMVNLIRPWIAANAVQLNISKDPVDDFKKLHGPAAYDALFETIVRFINELYQVGYGVITTVHIVNTKIQIGDDVMKFVPELCASEGLWKRLYPLMEWVGILHRKPVIETFDKEVISTLRGVETKSIRKESRSVEKVFLSVDNAEYRHISGGRVRFEPIEVPHVDGWAAVSKAYDAARATQMSGS
jgi:hypothetical protein